MSLRLLLPLLLAAAAAGYAAGVVLTPRWVDRGGSVPEPARASEARAEREALRALVDPRERSRRRTVFLERYPDSWLRARWAAESGR